MIVVDTSAILAVLQAEPEEHLFTAAMAGASRLLLSAGNYLECTLVMVSRGLPSRGLLDAWLRDLRVEIVAIDLELARLAADGFVRFGKGRHPAGLNYGDCFAYALAQQFGAPLLFKGNDFSRTDVRSALDPSR